MHTMMTNTIPIPFAVKYAVCIFMLILITGCEFDAVSDSVRRKKMHAQNKEILCYSGYLLRLIYVSDSIMYQNHKRIIPSEITSDLMVFSNETVCDSGLVTLKHTIHSIEDSTTRELAYRRVFVNTDSLDFEKLGSLIDQE
jgi:hypothetical protein